MRGRVFPTVAILTVHRRLLTSKDKFQCDVRIASSASTPPRNDKNMDIQKPKRKIWKWILIIIGIIVLIYAIYFVYQVWSIRNQILAGNYTGNYNWDEYGAETSGAGGANVSTQAFKVATTDDPALGAADAFINIVEFSDFQCPFSLKSFPIIRALAAKYPELVRFTYRDFPLEDIHPEAKLAAQAGYCANVQNLFWPLHDKLFQNQDKLSRETIISLATQAGLNRTQFLQCLDSAEAKKEVEQDQADGLAAGVAGTPTWFINGYRVAGVIPEDVFRKIVDGLITGNK